MIQAAATANCVKLYSILTEIYGKTSLLRKNSL
jgi:hypothetical protein